MRLSQVRITNFQSIQDSTEFKIGEITCLVGKNEAGKTALLKALYRLNPIRPSDDQYDVTDNYPRRDLVDYKDAIERKSRKPALVIRATYTLDKATVAEIERVYGKDCLPKHNAEVELSKGYSNKTICSNLTINTQAALSYILGTADLPASESDTLQSQDTVPKAIEFLKSRGSTEAIQKLLDRLQNIPDGNISKAIFDNIITPRLPKYLYFDEYYQMKGQDNLNALKSRRAQESLEEADEPLLGLIDLAGLDLDQLTDPGKTEALIASLEAAESQLSVKVLRYWSQNRHLRMKFDIRPAQRDDPPGMTDGMNILGRVHDNKHMVSTPLGTRSRGFIWFFSFLAWYSQLRKSNENIILLLDEPGLSLHAKAQADLLRYFEVELKPYHQLIYTTHSPFMVDPSHFDSVRIVQDLSIESNLDEDELPDEKQGTKVITDVLKATADSLFPLQSALGYEIHQTLFIGPNCLVVEGASDLLYIQGMSAILEKMGRTGLSTEWTITPVGGSAKISTFVALIGAQTNLNIAVLIDFQKSDRQQIENIYKAKILKKKKVNTYANFTQSDEADIEDMFNVHFYLGLVNGEYECAIQPAELASKHPRVLCRLDEYLKSNPLPSQANFNHYRPARYFNTNIDTLGQKLSNEELERFEKAFRTLNALL